MDIEMERLNGGVRQHDATIAYQISNTELLNGSIYKGAMKYPLNSMRSPWLASTPNITIQNASLACSYSGLQYFGHWLRDDLPLMLAAQDIAEPVTLERSLTNHQKEYSNFLDLHPQPINYAKFENLTVLHDVGQNRYKRERYQAVREKLKTLFPHEQHPGVMILRKSSGVKRVLVNEDEITQFLKSCGFSIIDPTTESVETMLQKSLGARIIVGVIGSQINHGLFSMADGGAEIALFPPFWFDNNHKDFMDCMGMRYGFVVGETVPEGFKINVQELEQILEKVQAALSSSS